MILAHRIALDPTYAQANAFARACGCARFTYNWALAEWNRQYAAGEKPNIFALKKAWNAAKREIAPWIYESPKGANQGVFAHLGWAFAGFFEKRLRYPKFKRKGDRDAFVIENDKLTLAGNRVRLPKIGWVKTHEALRLSGRVLGATVLRIADRWFLSVRVDCGSNEASPKMGGPVIGVDLGLTTFATLSTGEKIVAPKSLKHALRHLTHAQRVLSRRTKGSNRRYKAKCRVARIHRRICDIRHDFLNKLTTRLARENQAVAIEDLDVVGMLRNRRLARGISDAGWGEFRRQLTYKARLYGARLVVADRWLPSSKMCSQCGAVKAALALGERMYQCEACGYVGDRDVNAARNLYTLGLREIYARGPCDAAQEEAGTTTCDFMRKVESRCYSSVC